MTTDIVFKSPAGRAAILDVYDQVLALWPQPMEQMAIPTRFGDTFVVACGPPEAPPLLLRHGAGSNSSLWVADAAAYSSHFRIYAPDLPGEPGKSAPVRLDARTMDYVHWQDEILDALDIEKAALVGLSQGGWTVLNYAVHRPERVQQCVLMASAGIVSARRSFLLKAIWYAAQGQQGMNSLVNLVVGDTRLDKRAVDYMHLIMVHTRLNVESLPLLTDVELGRLSMPVMLIAGGQDAVYDGRKMVARMGKMVPHSRTVFLPQAGHILPDVTNYILPFLLANG
jgi:pimeloyl-ACP methyl ester carboxylesterase